MIKKVFDTKCPQCGAPIEYDPKTEKFNCKYCKNDYTLKEMQDLKVSSSVDNVKLEDSVDYSTYTCPDCGASIIADDQTSATFCIYCGNTAILRNKLTGEFAPDLIIPFKQEKELVTESFKKLSKGRPFMAREFNNLKNIEKIRGLYLPFWLYDITTSGSLDAEGTHITSWRVGDTQFTRKDEYIMNRTCSMNFIKVPIDGSSRFNNDIMDSISPFDYKELEAYNHSYLSGFLAERYDINKDQDADIIKNRCKNTSYNRILATMPYSTTNIVNNTLESNITNTYYALLPVWMVNVKYNNKFYTFAMNGQTGEFVGDIPLNKKRVVVYSIIIFVVVFLIVILISYIIFLGGII